MGYTHYYQMKRPKSPEWKAAWPKLIQAQKIVDASGVEIGGPDGEYEVKDENPPIISVDEGIQINGVDEMAHEPLILRQDDEWSFVKTASKPYDVVVACILLRAYMLVPGKFDLSSDGDWDEQEWIEARDLYHTLWPEEQTERPWEEEYRNAQS